MEKNAEQHGRQKQLGGITGRGFLPGHSGNPKGRPHTKGLLSALRLKVAEIAADGRTVEEHLVEVLVQEALRSKRRLPALEMIFDRLQGRARQQIEVADVTRQLREKSDAELQFYIDHDRWPNEDELPTTSDQAAPSQDRMSGPPPR